MNSVLAAQKVWRSFTNRRVCPTDDELSEAVSRVTKHEPAFVGRNALRRLKGHLNVLRAIVAYKPENPDEVAIQEQHLLEIANRPFDQEFCFPSDKPHHYAL